MIDCKFTRESKQIVEYYLQSVVVVDDYGNLDNEDLATQQDRFNSKKVIGSFADKGINCAVIAPSGAEDMNNLPNTISKLAKTSDVIIIDWAFGDTGGHARQLIENLVYRDEENKNRLRLIVIYTINNRLLDIMKSIFDQISEIAEGPDINKNEEEYSIYIDSTKITLLLKEAATVPAGYTELEDRKVPFEKLADRVIDEFSSMTHGLIPNVALQSIAEIRDNTSKLLKHFNKELDAPYLTHRSLLENPADAEELIVLLIVEELKSILEEKAVKEKADIKVIKQWLQYKKPGNQTFKVKIINQPTPKEWNKQQVTKLLEVGIPNICKNNPLNEFGISKTQFQRAHTNIRLSDMYQCSENPRQNVDEFFTELATIRSFYGKPNPVINLGTIIKTNKTTGDYYICIQPRCDCVRISDRTKFLFLPMKIQTDDNFELLAKTGGNFLYFSVDTSSYMLKTLEFEPKYKNKDRIIAHKRNGRYFFKDVKNQAYQWIGELKHEYALNISIKYSNELTRVGLHEPEWLRRRAK